jgi:hypothetical protein
MACRLRDCAEVWEMTLWRLLDKVDRANDRSAEPVGSAPYVRRLRDQAAVDRYMRDDMCDELAALCEAAAIVRALGYDPPGEVNAQPESSTVPLHCPKCGETFAGYLTTDVIFPHPTESMFRCGNPECGACWRVEFFEVTEDGED